MNFTAKSWKKISKMLALTGILVFVLSFNESGAVIGAAFILLACATHYIGRKYI